MYKDNFELCWGDLTPEAQKELLNTFGIKSVEDTNWDCMPITTLDASDMLYDRAKEIMQDIDCEHLLEQLNALKDNGDITNNLYEYIIENIDDFIDEMHAD